MVEMEWMNQCLWMNTTLDLLLELPMYNDILFAQMTVTIL